jgi:nitrate/TMAO reductase-like tetraheme cytochrome c subunit
MGDTGGQSGKERVALRWKVLGMVFVALLAGGVVVAAGGVYYTGKSSFCGGACHAMTEAYEGWKSSMHHASNNAAGREASCVECHFLPGEKVSWRGNMRGLRHLAAYLYDPQAPLPIRALVEDGSCLRAGCHAKDEVREKDIQFTEKVRFKHGVHFDDEALPGQTITCDTCHFKVTEEKHFEVPKEICFLCHLSPRAAQPAPTGKGADGLLEVAARRKLVFNDGAARCDLCHTIPTESLQSQLSAEDSDAEPITHEGLMSAGVPCESCHLESIEGHGRVDEGSVNANGCLTCHNWPAERVAETSHDRDLMHDKHIATRRADCFDCHGVIRHGEKRDYLEAVRSVCTSCHQNQHASQMLLLAGPARGDDIPETPSLMHAVRTNCSGCHTETVHANGQSVKAASGEACTDCHGEEQARMLADWKETLAEEITIAKEVEQEAVAALAAAEGRVEAERLAEARELLEAGRETLGLVEHGNGVHNKKYSILLLDVALTNFEDLVDSLQE